MWPVRQSAKSFSNHGVRRGPSDLYLDDLRPTFYTLHKQHLFKCGRTSCTSSPRISLRSTRHGYFILPPFSQDLLSAGCYAPLRKPVTVFLIQDPGHCTNIERETIMHDQQGFRACKCAHARLGECASDERYDNVSVRFVTILTTCRIMLPLRISGSEGVDL